MIGRGWFRCGDEGDKQGEMNQEKEREEDEHKCCAESDCEGWGSANECNVQLGAEGRKERRE